MTTRFISVTDLDSNGLPGGGVKALETVIVQEGVLIRASLAGADLNGRNAPVFEAELYLSGTIVSETDGVNFVDGAAKLANNLVHIREMGEIHATIIGVEIGGAGNLVIHEGLISASEGIVDSGGASRIEVSGRITARNLGVGLLDGSTLRNDGVIGSRDVGVRATGAASVIDNAGLVSGRTGIQLSSGSGQSLINSGRITGTEVGVSVTSTAGWLINTGTIDGTEAAIRVSDKLAGRLVLQNLGTLAAAGGDAFLDTGASINIVSNLGAMLGDVDLGGAGDVFDNFGMVDGSVDLGTGDDIFRGQNDGHVRGTVFGGEGIDQLSGGRSSDRLNGGADTDFLFGGAGDDFLDGGAGRDALLGGAGDDLLQAGEDADKLRGGAGDDELSGNSGADTLSGGEGADSLFGGADADRLAGDGGDDALDGGAGADILFGGAGEDELFGGAGADTLWGGDGYDLLAGGAQNDVLRGGQGDDTLRGGGGRDTLTGGAGDDVLTGQGGADTFVIDRSSGHDTVTDFTDGADLIDLRALGLADYATLSAASAIRAVSAGVFIDLTRVGIDGSILLLNAARDDITAADFLL